MLSNLLNTNEVKDRTGTEVEFTRISTNGRETEFAKVGEVPSQPYRLYVKHTETGEGLRKRRRSTVMFRKTTIAEVDSVTPVTSGAYVVIDSPVGAMTTNNVLTDLIANLLSFVGTTGAASTVLFDGTGTGAKCLTNGDL